MAKTRTQVNIDTDTFGGLIIKLNQLLSDESNIIITTDADGSTGVTSGNAHVSGKFSANTIYAGTLSGGNNSVAGALTISSNTSFEGALTSIISANTSITGDLNVVNVVKNAKVDVLNTTIKSAANTRFDATTLIANTTTTNLTSVGLTMTSNTAAINIGSVLSLTANTANVAVTTFALSANTLTFNGNASFANTIAGSINGNANTASKWANSRTITLTGDLTGTITIDGSANVSANVAVNDNSHYHTIGDVTNLSTELSNRLLTTGKAADTTLFDGNASSLFVRTDTLSQKNSKLQMMGQNAVTFGDSSELEIFYDPSGLGYVRTVGNGIYIRRASDSVNVHRFFTNGDYIANGEVYAHSDERLKDNIVTIQNALDKVKQLRGVSYTKDGKNSIGVIAQEIIKIVPEVVQGDGEDNFYSVTYGNLVALLIEAIKEQQKQIDELVLKTSQI